MSLFARSRRLAVCGLFGAGFFASTALGSEPGPAGKPPAAVPPADQKTNGDEPGEFSRLRGVFDVDLPKTVPRNKVKLILHPHFGDLRRKSYLRIPVGVRLGLSDHTELSTEIEGYVPHGLRSGDGRLGVGVVRVGGKYKWLHWLKGRADASSGLNLAVPVGKPPADMTDGQYHASPYVVFSKTLPRYPRLTPFVSFGADLMWKASLPGKFGENRPREDALLVTPGFFYDAKAFKYTFACTYATTALIGNRTIEGQEFLEVNPSVLWQIPRKLTFNSKGQWVLGVGLKAVWGPDGMSVSTSTKVRGEFSFRRMLGSARDRLQQLTNIGSASAADN